MFLFSGENEKCLEERDCRYLFYSKLNGAFKKTQVNRIKRTQS